MPGVGEEDGCEDEGRQSALGTRRSARLGKYSAAASGETSQTNPRSNTTIRVGEAKHSSLPSEDAGENVALAVDSVQSASWRQVILWASTSDVILLVLAAACRQQEEQSCSTPETETQWGTTETTGASGVVARSTALARSTACALLTRVFGNGTIASEDYRDKQVPGIGEKESSIVLDRWYEGFMSTTAPSHGRGGGRGGARESSSFPLLRKEAPTLLLQGMLEIPAVKTGFVKRGLTRHLTDVLRVASAEIKLREQECYLHSPNIGCSRGGDASSSSLGFNKIHKEGHGVPQSCLATIGGNLGAQNPDADDQPTSPLENFQQWLPWWLLFSKGRAEREDGHDHNFEDAIEVNESIDGGRSTEPAARTCRTTLSEIFVPEGEGEAEERGLDTRGDDGPTVDGFSDDVVGNSLTDPVGETPVSTKAKSQKYGELDGMVDRSSTGEGSTSSTTRGRVAPPMLRLDALDSILDANERAVPTHLRSSHAAVTLSAASTRAASEHLVRSSVYASAAVSKYFPIFLFSVLKSCAFVRCLM